jgi:hypothetical protein
MMCMSISIYHICPIRHVVSACSRAPSYLAVAVCVIFSNIVFSNGSLAAQTEVSAVRPSVKTDRGVYPLPPAPTLPKAGGVFTDPTFGIQIMRVTDEQDGGENCNAYSYWPSFNADSTRFHIACGNRPVLYNFDPKGFRLIGKEPLFARKPPSGHEPRWEDAMWAYADPNLLYCHEGLNLWAYNVVTAGYKLVKDFSNTFPPGHLCQLSRDSRDDVFAGSLQDPKWNRTGYFVWRRATDKIVLRDTVDHDEVQVDKAGRFCVVKTGRQGKGVVEVRVVDLRTGRIEDLTDDGPDFAPGHSDNGHGLVVGHDNVRNRVTFRRLDSPHDIRTLLDLKSDWSQDYHVSMLADDESWATLSFYVGNSLPSSGIFRGEIIQIATDGSRLVRRLSHHRSVFKSYWDSPRANISRDGRFIVFTSNWEGTGQRDVFILKVPAM